jgi:gamma-glutamyl hercynylcysteine S-oxide synthase
MPATSSDVVARNNLIEQVADARRRTDELFAVVNPEFLYERPIAERHRIVFYIGHLEAFDWNLLGERVLNLKSFHPAFDKLFAFGIDPVGGGLPTDDASDWPEMRTVHEYVERLRNILDDELANALDGSARRKFDGFPLAPLVNVAIEHRLMHAETLAYMLHQLALNRKIPQRESLHLKSSSLNESAIQIPTGEITLGLSRSSGQFGWDNEFEAHTVDVPRFAIDRYMVTNGQFLEFINDRGYQRRELWVSGGDDRDWRWKSESGISHPAFWKSESSKQEGNNKDNWLYRTMFAEIPLPLEWPVYVSQAESKAFAKWAGKSLPTEAEWQRAADGSLEGETRNYPWGNDDPAPQFGNFDFANWSPVPVNAFPESASAFGVEGMVGNGWEWTASEFAPFPGFEPFPFYRGYSADFFDGKHFVIKGGSARTAVCMLRPTFRNWFQSHYQYMYAGFRCVSRHSSGDKSSR